ncbi:MAG TPA: hypothetical protein VNX66_07815 [Candidatus Sulfotelmatobacter sp.]|nr:hypothetical protein [Candidatus Sulfotelmatobacter sp.]
MLIPFLAAASLFPSAGRQEQQTHPDDEILQSFTNHQYDLQSNGRDFLLNESRKSEFFLLGELHGDNEIPAFLRDVWPELWKQGYRHIAAEISPWAAYQLESVPVGKGPEIRGLWTKDEAISVHGLASPNANVLWGCDIEEEQPQLLIRQLAALNPMDHNLEQMVAITEHGYDRKTSLELLRLAKKNKKSRDEIVNDVSLRQNLLATLEIEEDRLSADSKMVAQDARELLMKEQFLTHYRRSLANGTPSKVLARFGRNHLHRGYDARGISTLGNFLTEFAVAQGRTAFNVGAFGAGGMATLMGDTWDADERQDELALLRSQRAQSIRRRSLICVLPDLCCIAFLGKSVRLW